MFSYSKISRAIETRERKTRWCWPQFVTTHEMCFTCSIWPQIWKDWIIQTSLAMALKIKDPPTWLKVATTSEKDPTPFPFYQVFIVSTCILQEKIVLVTAPNIIRQQVEKKWYKLAVICPWLRWTIEKSLSNANKHHHFSMGRCKKDVTPVR